MTTKRIVIHGRKSVDYFVEALTAFNNGTEQLVLEGSGGNVGRCVEVTQMICEEIGVSSKGTKIGTKTVAGIPVPTIETTLALKGKSLLAREKDHGHETVDPSFGTDGFVNYTTYHLLLSHLLHKHGKLTIQANPDYFGNGKYDKGPKDILEISLVNGRKQYEITLKGRDRDRTDLTAALGRAGLLFPRNWREIAHKLSEHDDVVLGLDTNVLRNNFVTAHLLPAVSMVEPKQYVHTPNWMLLVVPGTVMFELEQAANHRYDWGKLKKTGRMGFRAIQEIIELSENIDIRGVSLMIAGETDPALDTRASLQTIGRSLHMIGKNNGHTGSFNFKSTGGDMTIRSQFKKFLRQIDFHKGTYFLTADKTNSALAMAEGLRPLYVGPCTLENANGELQQTLVEVDNFEEEKGVPPVPLGRLLYELAITYQNLMISYGSQGNIVTLESDVKGDSLLPWLHHKMHMYRKDLDKLIQQYEGRFSLHKTVELWRKFTANVETIDWVTEVSNVFASPVED